MTDDDTLAQHVDQLLRSLARLNITLDAIQGALKKQGPQDPTPQLVPDWDHGVYTGRAVVAPEAEPEPWPYMVDTSTARRLAEKDNDYA